MGKFCTKCGRPLAEGEVCNCQSAAPQPQAQPVAPTPVEPTPAPQQGQYVQETPVAPVQPQYQQTAPQVQPQYQQAAQQGQPQYQQAAQQGQPQYQQAAPQMQPQYQQMAPQQPSAAGTYFKELWSTALNIFKAPATEGKKYVAEGKFKFAIGYMVVQAVLAVILGMTFEGRSGLATLGSYDFWSGSTDTGMVALAYVKVFFITLVLSALFSVMLAGLILGFNAIAKNHMTFKNALCLASVRSIVLAPAMVVAWILTIINPFFGGFVSLIINIWGMVAIMKALPVASEKADNLVTHMMSAAFAIFALVSMGLMFTVGALCYSSGILSQIGSLLSYL